METSLMLCNRGFHFEKALTDLFFKYDICRAHTGRQYHAAVSRLYNEGLAAGDHEAIQAKFLELFDQELAKTKEE